MSKGRTRAEITDHGLLPMSRSSSLLEYPKAWLSSTLGVPSRNQTLSFADYFSTVFCLLCCGLGLSTVYVRYISAWLGQVNQLIALGFLLQLMALCTQRHLQIFLLAVECLWNQSSLRSFDSIIRMSLTQTGTAWPIRMVLFFALTLPVVLGVAYKNFTGGITESDVVHSLGSYGMTGPPGTFNMGLMGMALFFNASLPWWNEPRDTGSYGFNLNVESNSRAALLDGPSMEHIVALQNTLRPTQSVLLSATVNATVADMVIDLTDTTKTPDLAMWFDNVSWYKNTATASTTPVEAVDDFYAAYREWGNWTQSVGTPDRLFGLVIPPDSQGWVWNNSFVMTSRWNETNGETFGSAAQGYFLSRQTYTASWRITKWSVSLEAAQPVTGAYLTDDPSIGIIQYNYISLQDEYPRIFFELDWKFMPGRTGIKSDTTLVATMLWSRLTTANGLENPAYNSAMAYDTPLRYSSKQTSQISSPTLKRSPFLTAVLLVNPAIVLTLLAVRVILLRNAPISQDFGIVSVLAAVEMEDQELLKGAGYSGKLKKDIRVRFEDTSSAYTQYDNEEETAAKMGTGKVVLRLEAMRGNGYSGHVQNDRLRKGFVYE